jgi:hypothetical protein
MATVTYVSKTIKTGETVSAVCKKYAQPTIPANLLTSNVTYAAKALERLMVQENPKISRTRPEKPMFKSPTALPEQFREHLKYRQALWQGDLEVVSMPGACPVGYATYGFRSIWDTQPPNYTITRPVQSDLGWALKVRRKLEDEVVSLGESLFEYRETCGMFVAAANTVVDAWKQYRKLKRLKFGRMLNIRDVAATEVISVLGINPLLGTVYDVCDVLQNRLEEPVYRKVVANVAQEDRRSITQYGGVTEGTWKTSQRAILYFDLDVEARRIEIGNPLEIAWELVPFSFVVDWFIPIGDWLGSLDALKGVKQVWGTVTQRQSYTGTDSSRTDYLGLNDLKQKVLVPGAITAAYHKRWVQNSVPVPVPRWWKPSASWKKLMTASSLLYLLRTSS